MTFAGMPVQGQGLQEEGSMDPDDDLGDDDIKDDDQLSMPYHGAHAHMHSIPHNPHQMGQPVPGMGCVGPVHAVAQGHNVHSNETMLPALTVLTCIVRNMQPQNMFASCLSRARLEA